jgi:hypothetical protein
MSRKMADQVSMYPTGVVVTAVQRQVGLVACKHKETEVQQARMGKGHRLVLIMFSGVRASETRLANSKPCPSFSPQNELHPGRNLLLMVQNLFRAASTARKAVQRTPHKANVEGDKSLPKGRQTLVQISGNIFVIYT